MNKKRKLIRNRFQQKRKQQSARTRKQILPLKAFLGV